MWGNKLSMVKYSKSDLASREALALLRDDSRGFELSHNFFNLVIFSFEILDCFKFFILFVAMLLVC